MSAEVTVARNDNANQTETLQFAAAPSSSAGLFDGVLTVVPILAEADGELDAIASVLVPTLLVIVACLP
jgi:hypothetical protein